MRDLKPGDRVKITGSQRAYGTFGMIFIGRIAIVMDFLESGTPIIKLDSWNVGQTWCRENLRALPRRK